MNLDDYIFAFLCVIGLGILIYMAMTLNDLLNLFKQWVERR
jgi:hypothetical protein